MLINRQNYFFVGMEMLVLIRTKISSYLRNVYYPSNVVFYISSTYKYSLR